MPLGSSSAAPVMSPGPSRLARPSLWPLIFTLTYISDLPVQPRRVERRGAAILVVAGVGDALRVGREREAGAEVGAVVQLREALVAVAQRALAREGREAAALEVRAMRRGDRVRADGQADDVLVARPARALQR